MFQSTNLPAHQIFCVRACVVVTLSVDLINAVEGCAQLSRKALAFGKLYHGKGKLRSCLQSTQTSQQKEIELAFLNASDINTQSFRSSSPRRYDILDLEVWEHLQYLV